MKCCGQPLHAWDEFRVEEEWVPTDLRCLVVGENPGSTDSAYFYEGSKTVPVRTMLLRELYQRALISAPTFSEFRTAGFLFDHGIRCHLTVDEVKAEARLARRYASPRCATADHLRPWIQRAWAVWIMGYIARNAVAAICREFPPDRRKISRPPYPRQIPEAPRFFVSRYLTRASRQEVTLIGQEVALFLKPLLNKRDRLLVRTDC